MAKFVWLCYLNIFIANARSLASKMEKLDLFIMLCYDNHRNLAPFNDHGCRHEACRPHNTP